MRWIPFLLVFVLGLAGLEAEGEAATAVRTSAVGYAEKVLLDGSADGREAGLRRWS